MLGFSPPFYESPPVVKRFQQDLWFFFRSGLDLLGAGPRSGRDSLGGNRERLAGVRGRQ
jgi:hypothetical protein